MRKYDSTFIIDGTLGAEEREALIEKFKNSLEKLGGEIDQIVRWGQRTLAYEIKKRNLGYYVIFYYSAEPSIIEKFERELRINENVLRYMTVIFDGNYPSYIMDKNVDKSNSVSEKKPLEIEKDLDDIGDDVDLDEDVSEEEIEADDILEENFVEEENETASDSEVADSDNEIENIEEKEEK